MTRISRDTLGLLTLHTDALAVCNSTGVLASIQYNEAVVVGTWLLAEFTNACDVGGGVEFVEVLSVLGKALLSYYYYYYYYKPADYITKYKTK